MSTVKYRFKITDAAREAHAARTGRVLAPTDVLSLDLDTLTEAERGEIIAALRMPYGPDAERDVERAGYKLSAIPETPADWLAVARGFAAALAAEKAEYEARKDKARVEYLAKTAERFDVLEPLNDAVLSQHRSGRNDFLPYCEYSIELPPVLAERYEALKARLYAYLKRYGEEEAQRKAEKEATDAAKRHAAETERQEWIEANGSEFLRKATDAGYDCQRRYVTERAAIEHPGATVDFGDNAAWKSRSCPSEAALDLALEIDGTVVWLTDSPRTEKRGVYEDYDFDPCEAVVVRGYLGKYDVVYMSF